MPEVDLGSDADLRRAAERLGVEYLLLTLGAGGMKLIPRDTGQSPHQVDSLAREVFDVSGAGDTVTAWAGTALAAGGTPMEAAEIANLAAGVEVGKRGVATVTPAEVLAAHGRRSRLPVARRPPRTLGAIVAGVAPCPAAGVGFRPVSYGRLAQLVRARASHARGRGFEPLIAHCRTNTPRCARRRGVVRSGTQAEPRTGAHRACPHRGPTPPCAPAERAAWGSTAPAARPCRPIGARRPSTAPDASTRSGRPRSAPDCAARSLRRAQFTPFFTKLRSSRAPCSMSGRNARKRASGAALSCRARHAIRTKPPRFTNSRGERGPLPRLLPRQRRPVPQLEADGVTVAPVLEARRPGIHLPSGHPFRIADQRREQPRLVPSALPQRDGQVVIGPQLFLQLEQRAHRHSERMLRDDTVARHALEGGPGAPPLEGRQHLLQLLRCHRSPLRHRRRPAAAPRSRSSSSSASPAPPAAPWPDPGPAQLAQDGGNDLPRQAVPVLEPAAGLLLPAGREPGPQLVDFLPASRSSRRRTPRA